MGVVLLKEGRMKGERKRHLPDVSGKSTREQEKADVWLRNKNIHLETLFNQKRRDADGSVAPGGLSNR